MAHAAGNHKYRDPGLTVFDGASPEPSAAPLYSLNMSDILDGTTSDNRAVHREVGGVYVYAMIMAVFLNLWGVWGAGADQVQTISAANSEAASPCVVLHPLTGDLYLILAEEELGTDDSERVVLRRIVPGAGTEFSVGPAIPVSPDGVRARAPHLLFHPQTNSFFAVWREGNAADDGSERIRFVELDSEGKPVGKIQILRSGEDTYPALWLLPIDKARSTDGKPGLLMLFAQDPVQSGRDRGENGLWAMVLTRKGAVKSANRIMAGLESNFGVHAYRVINVVEMPELPAWYVAVSPGVVINGGVEFAGKVIKVGPLGGLQGTFAIGTGLTIDPRLERLSPTRILLTYRVSVDGNRCMGQILNAAFQPVGGPFQPAAPHVIGQNAPARPTDGKKTILVGMSEREIGSDIYHFHSMLVSKKGKQKGASRALFSLEGTLERFFAIGMKAKNRIFVFFTDDRPFSQGEGDLIMGAIVQH